MSLEFSGAGTAAKEAGSGPVSPETAGPDAWGSPCLSATSASAPANPAPSHSEERAAWSADELSILRLMAEHGASNREIAGKIQRSRHAIMRKRAALGLPAPDNGRPIPADFAEKATLPEKRLAAIYNVGLWQVRVWRQKTGYRPGRRGPQMQIPADFRERWETMNIEQCATHYGKAKQTIASWRDALGLVNKPSRQMRAPPADLAECCKTMNQTQLIEHFHCHPRTMRTWLDETGLSPLKAPKQYPVPDDFRETASRLDGPALQRLYNVGRGTITKWRKETGVLPPGYVKGVNGHFRTPRLGTYVMRDATLYERAANFLRPQYVPVCRVEYTSRANLFPKNWYVVGKRGVMSPDDMLNFARSRGFDPDAWKQVAA